MGSKWPARAASAAVLLAALVAVAAGPGWDDDWIAPPGGGLPESPPVAVEPTPVGGDPSMRHLEEKRYMLGLINRERVKAGLSPVVLGSNFAAQLHVEASLEGCVSSHWGLDGLKPYMRYSLAGGHQSNAENLWGLDYCITESDGYASREDLNSRIDKSMTTWLKSEGHRSNILNRWHKKVNIGLAFDEYNTVAVQHFEGDYVDLDQLPAITDGVLRGSGTVKNGVDFRDRRDLLAQVRYDPPPHPLTRGQVSRIYGYGNGRPIAGLRPPPSPGYVYSSNQVTRFERIYTDPHSYSADWPGPASAAQARAIWEAAKTAIWRYEEVTYPWITATTWAATEHGFKIEADLSGLLEEHGPGVYTIMLWGRIDGRYATIVQYSIFHEVAK